MLKFIIRKVADYQIEVEKQKARLERQRVIQDCFAETGHVWKFIGETKESSWTGIDVIFDTVNVYQCERCGHQRRIDSFYDLKK